MPSRAMEFEFDLARARSSLRKSRGESDGSGYQTLINATLRESLLGSTEKLKPITVATLQRVLREELQAA